MNAPSEWRMASDLADPTGQQREKFIWIFYVIWFGAIDSYIDFRLKSVIFDLIGNLVIDFTLMFHIQNALRQ